MTDNITSLSRNGKCEIASYEGLSNFPYLDSVSVKTFSLGITEGDEPLLKTWGWDKFIDTQTCINYFVKALSKYEKAVADSLKVVVTQYQFDALVSITYNIGISGEDHSTFLREINSHSSINNIEQAIMMWDRGGGRVIKGLENRRNNECKLFANGIYSSGGNVCVIKTNTTNGRVISECDHVINIYGYL